MSEDFATLVSKLNEMSEDNYQKEEVTKEVVTESANDMRGILDKFNTITESNILAQKGNIKMVMTESHTDHFNVDVMIDDDVVASGQYDRLDNAYTIDNDDFTSADEVLEAFAQTAHEEGKEFKESEVVAEATPDESYVHNMFEKALTMINSLEKVFRQDGLMMKKIDAIGGDNSCCNRIAQALSDAYESLETGHYDAMAHIHNESKLKAELEAALNEEPVEEEKKNCGCGQDPCVTYGEEKSNESE